jgi:hypothetical protein
MTTAQTRNLPKRKKKMTTIVYRRRPTILGYLFLFFVFVVPALQGIGLVPLTRLQLQNQYFWGTTPEQATFIRDRVFRTVCADWKEQGFFGRYITYRDQAWCADYQDRL